MLFYLISTDTMPRRTKRAKQCAQIVSKRPKVEDELSVCNQDQVGESSLSKSMNQKTNVASSMCSTCPVTTIHVEGTRPTHADVLSGQARPENSRETHVPVNGKGSVSASVEHIFSKLPKEYSPSGLEHDSTAPSTSNIADAFKHLTVPCKEMYTRRVTNVSHMQERENQTNAHGKPKQQKKVSADVQSGVQRCKKASKVTIPLTNRQVQKPRTNLKKKILAKKQVPRTPTRFVTIRQSGSPNEIKNDKSACQTSTIEKES